MSSPQKNKFDLGDFDKIFEKQKKKSRYKEEKYTYFYNIKHNKSSIIIYYITKCNVFKDCDKNFCYLFKSTF